MEQFTGLAQYGMAGFFILALIAAVIYFVRRQDRLEKANDLRHVKLESKFDAYMEKDRESMLKCIETNAAVIKENSTFLHEVKTAIELLKK